jgi:hypothetical protein
VQSVQSENSGLIGAPAGDNDNARKSAHSGATGAGSAVAASTASATTAAATAVILTNGNTPLTSTA